MAASKTSSLFNKANADVIIRSCDGTDLRLHKVILSLASPVFEGMFTIPAEPSQDGSVQTVDLTESATTLEDLFRFCYPVERPEFSQLDHLRSVLAAAHKYDMNYAIKPLMSSFRVFLPSEALRVYCIAYMHEDADLARAAARCLLDRPRLFDSSILPPELDEVPATALVAVMTYRDECAKAAQAVLLDYDWLQDGFPHRILHISRKGNPNPSAFWIWFACQSCPSSIKGASFRACHIYPRVWWQRYHDAAVTELALFSCPLPSVVTQKHLIGAALEEAEGCETCRPKAASELREYAEAASKRIDVHISKINIRLPFDALEDRAV
ncbi:hypothetical protein BD414DRAFT_535549 [Trametes punicea]|nr:hypothetical protein BD414DRAFT_535549 [Trametes punicea]